MPSINQRMAKLVDLCGLERYKIGIAIILGLFGFIGSFYAIKFTFLDLKLNIIWSLIFPLLVTLTWGRNYGLISISFGLTAFYTLVLGPFNGWACLVPFFKIFLWVMLQGYGVEKRKESSKFYYNLYFLQSIYAIICLFLYATVFPWLIKFNPPFWYKDAVTTVNSEFLIAIAVKGIINEFLVVAICDVLLILPFVRKIFLLEDIKAAKYNGIIILFTVILGWFFITITMFTNDYVIDHKPILNWLFYPDNKTLMTFFFNTISCLLIGGVAAKFFQKYSETEGFLRESEKKYQLLYEKMLNGFYSFRPIYDSKDNLVDFLFIEVNPSFTKEMGLAKENLVGKRWSEVFNHANGNLDIYQRIVRTCQSQHFEIYNKEKDLYYLVNAFLVKNDEVGVIFENITPYRKLLKEIQSLNEDLEQRVINRTNELELAVNELEAFTYTVSHDLKSPLRAIDGYSRFILEDYGSKLDIEACEMLNNIRNISRDMITLVNKLLEYSLTSKLKVNKEEIEMGEMFLSVFMELSPSHSETKREFNFEGVLPLVVADRVLIKQVVYNVLSNAIKFTQGKERAVIRIGSKTTKNEHIFYVKDNGAGFDMEFSGKLFGIFQRLHTADEFEGSGVGLATVRKIIQKHGGRVWIEGEVDKGATVYFTLPFVS